MPHKNIVTVCLVASALVLGGLSPVSAGEDQLRPTHRPESPAAIKASSRDSSGFSCCGSDLLTGDGSLLSGFTFR